MDNENDISKKIMQLLEDEEKNKNRPKIDITKIRRKTVKER